MRVLLAMWEGGGTIPPELTIARKLIARGHDVRVLGDPTIERSARTAGCGFSPWVTAPHRTNLDPSTDILRDWEFKNPFALLRHGMKAFFCGPAGRFADDTARVMQEYRPDVVLHGHAHGGSFEGAIGTTPVYNVAVPVTGRDFYVFELEGHQVEVETRA